MQLQSESKLDYLLRPEYDYINDINEDEIDEELKCKYICHRPLINPITHNKCGNMFCESCIFKVQYKCPICNNKCKDEYEPVIIRLILNKLNKML